MIPRPSVRAAAVRHATLALIVGALGACATSQPREVVQLEPMRLAAVDQDGKKVVEQLDPATLFREAGRAFEDGDYASAARKYGLIVEHFPKSRYVNVARFNAGLSLERDGRCPDAIPYMESVVAALPRSKDAQDALFRIAICDRELRRWDRALSALNQLLAPEYEGITDVNRLEAHALRGLARHKRGELALAERDYLKALELYKDNLANRAFRNSAHVSLAQFQIGEIYRELFGSIRFRLPLERMARDLEDKSNYFLKSQAAYLRTLRHQHRDYAPAAGYRLGAIYEQFYDDMMGAEIPRDLSREEVEIYYEELKKKIRPLIVKAISIYERNIRMGQRIGESEGEWVQKSQASLARLKEVLRQESTRKAESTLSAQ